MSAVLAQQYYYGVDLYQCSTITGKLNSVDWETVTAFRTPMSLTPGPRPLIFILVSASITTLPSSQNCSTNPCPASEYPRCNPNASHCVTVSILA